MYSVKYLLVRSRVLCGKDFTFWTEDVDITALYAHNCAHCRRFNTNLAIISVLKYLWLALYIYSRSQWPTARSKAWVCGYSLYAIVGSNPTGDIDVCLL